MAVLIAMVSGLLATTTAVAAPPVAEGQRSLGSATTLGSTPATAFAQQSPSVQVPFVAMAEAQSSAKASRVRAIIKMLKWLKKVVPSAFKKIKGAVKSGYGGFKNWYNGLHWALKAPFRAFFPALSLYEIWTSLYDYFF